MGHSPRKNLSPVKAGAPGKLVRMSHAFLGRNKRPSCGGRLRREMIPMLVEWHLMAALTSEWRGSELVLLLTMSIFERLSSN